AESDRRLGLESRPETAQGRAGLADERLPQSVLPGLRLEPGGPVARTAVYVFVGHSRATAAPAAGRPRWPARPGRALRRHLPCLAARVPRLPGRGRAVLGRLVLLRAVRGP